MKEAALPLDAGTLSKGDLTIEKILEEKKMFDLSVRFEKFGDGDEDLGWTLPGTLFISAIIYARVFVHSMFGHLL